MPMFILSKDRTRSKRWRSGTRRNKQYHTASVKVCSNPTICIIHNGLVTSYKEATRIKLTRCEQQWVDDVRTGKRNLHGDLKGSSKDMMRLRRINTIRRHGSRINRTTIYRRGMDISDRWYPRGS